MIVVLVLVMPVAVLASMTLLAGLLGGMVGRSSDLDNTTADGEPNEHLALSRENPYSS